MTNENRIPLSNELIQQIGDYLITRPYREVAMLISGLQTEIQALGAQNKSNGAQGFTEPELPLEHPQ